MAFKDFRDYLEQLEQHGELHRVTAEVDWDLELGAISRRALDTRAPALLFENIRGYAPGHRVAANFLGPSSPHRHARMALTMGESKETPVLDLISSFRRRVRTSIPPRVVDTAPCKEVIVTGEDIDILALPVPLIHGTDGGRYIGTWHVDVTRDPDSGWTNWGMYRHMVIDKSSIGWMSSPAQHGMGHYLRKYENRGVPMPIAIALGTEPMASIVAGSQMPAFADDAAIAGGLRGEAVDLVRCETVDLEVPASAEIVLEGLVYPDERALEGDFGEFTGYATGSRDLRPVVRLTCVTHRRDPILPIHNGGKPWDDYGVMASVTMSALLANDLEDRAIPFTSLFVPPPIMSVVVGVPRQYPGIAHTVADAIWSSKSGIYRPFVIAVGDDVDVTDADEVMWCLTTRLHPENGVHVHRRTPALQLWPFLTEIEREQRIGSKLLLDATFPASWDTVPTVIDFAHGWPADVQQRVVDRWGEYGLG